MAVVCHCGKLEMVVCFPVHFYLLLLSFRTLGYCIPISFQHFICFCFRNYQPFNEAVIFQHHNLA